MLNVCLNHISRLLHIKIQQENKICLKITSKAHKAEDSVWVFFKFHCNQNYDNYFFD